MTDKIESKGKTVKDAVNEALLQMGARKDEVQIEVLEEPKSGLFGILGGKPARVLVTRKKSRGSRGRRNQRNHNDDAVAHNLSDGRSSRGGSQGGGRQRRNDENQDGARGDNRRSRGGRNRRNDNRQDNNRPDNNRQSERAQDGSRQENNRQEGNRQEGRRQGGGRQGGKRQDERRSGGRQQKPAAQVSNDMPSQDQNDNRSQGQNARGGRNQNEGRSQGGSRRPRSRSRRSQNDPRNLNRRDMETSGNNLDNQSAATDPAQPMENNIPQEEVQGRGRGRSNRSNRTDRPERSERSDRSERQGRGRRQDNDRASNKQGGRGRGQSNAPDQKEAQTRPAARTEQPMVPDEVIHTGISAVKYSTPVRDIAEDAVDQMLEDFTNGMLNRAGFPVRCEVKPGDYRQVRVITDDSSAGMLIGRHGAAIDSIEHLVERMAGMAAGDRVRMNLDINNYRRRRQDTLQDRVLDAVDVVLEKDRTFHMEPMNPRERRLVHLQVENLEGVRTFTMGGGPAKHVVIAPDNGEDNGDKRNRDAKPEAEAQPENKEAPAAVESEFDEFDDGPQPETNELVVDDDDHRRLI